MKGRSRAQTLEGLLLKQRIGRTFTHYGKDAARDLDALLTARAATLPFVAAAGLDLIFAAIERHRLTLEVFTEASNAADEVAIVQRGDDTSPGAMAVLDARRDVAAAADEQAWRDLFAEPPETAGGLVALLHYCALRYHAYHGMPDEPDVFAVLAAAARGLARQHHQHRAFVAAAGQMFGHEATTEIWARAAQQVPAAFANGEGGLMHKTNSRNAQARTLGAALNSRRNAAGIEPGVFKEEAAGPHDPEERKRSLIREKIRISKDLTDIKALMAAADADRQRTGRFAPRKTWLEWTERRAALVAELQAVEVDLAGAKVLAARAHDVANAAQHETFAVAFMKTAKEMLTEPIYMRVIVATTHRVGDAQDAGGVP